MKFFRWFLPAFAKRLKATPHTYHHRYKPLPLNQIIMRLNLLAFIIAFSCIQVSATGLRAQNISLKVKDMPLAQVFEAIEKQSGYGLWYEKKEMPKNATITIDLKNVPLKDALDQCLKNQPLTYTIVDQMIMIKAKEKNLINRITDYLKQKTVSGKVTDEKGQALPGVNISLKGKNKNTVTDAEGRFSMEADETDVLIFTFLGYTLQQQTVGKKTLFDIQLAEAIGQLDQVQIQGYGTTTQRLATGNIATIKAETIAQQPVTNPILALSGRMAGVQITQTSGLPGAAVTVAIRGRNSIGASNDPLYVVDDVPFFADIISGNGRLTQISPLNSISPNDIESITVLKDADATAIYGSRGANGVVLITTKKGTAEKSKLDVNVNRGFSSVTKMVEVMSTPQYLQMRRDAFANSGITPTVANAPDLLTWDPNLDNNIMEWYYGNTADVWDTGASFGGGNTQTQFLLSGNYHQEKTMFSDNDKYARGNLHISLNHTSLNKKLRVKFTGLYSSDNSRIQNSVAGTTLFSAQAVPNYPYFDSNGNYNWVASQTNHFATATAYAKTSSENINLNVNVDYQIHQRIKFTTSVGYSSIINENVGVQPSTSRDPNSSAPLGLSSFRNTSAKTYIFEPQLNYVKPLIGGKLSLLVGSTIQRRNSIIGQVSLNNYLTDLLLESKNGGSVILINSANSEYNFLSIFARANFNWKDRYLVNGTFRRDGSGRFGPNNRFGNFGSIGAAWIFSNEHFLKNKLSWLSHGKIRASYGTTGSDGIGDFAYLSLYTTTTDYGTQKAISPSQIANGNYKWEVTKKAEIALDLSFLKDHILFSSSWYNNRSGNQLVTYPLPTTTGFSGYTANLPALVQNSGWEFEMNSQNISKPNLIWSTNVNLTIPRNKLVSFPDLDRTSYANTLVVGKPLNAYLGYQFLGVDPNTGIGSVLDINGNNIISANSSYNNQGGDKIYVGTTDPKWFAGLNNTIIYKGFQVDLFFQYTEQKGYNLFYNANGFNSFGQLRNMFSAYSSYWKQPGDNSQIPKPFSNSNASIGQYAQSDKAFSNSSFLRLKNLSIKYALSSLLAQRIGFSKIELFVQGQNLWTSTNYVGPDPEQANSIQILNPSMKTFTFGFKTAF